MGFKDWWKSKPYWLRGGIIGFFVMGFVDIMFITNNYNYFNKLGLLICFWSISLIPYLQDLSVFLDPLINGFIIGAIIGLIYYIIKSKINWKKFFTPSLVKIVISLAIFLYISFFIYPQFSPFLSDCDGPCPLSFCDYIIIFLLYASFLNFIFWIINYIYNKIKKAISKK